MSKRWDVLGVGAVAVDDLVYVDRFPEPDSKMQIRDERRQGGGPVATGLVAAHRLGSTAAFLGILGDDLLSRSAIEELEAEGVDCSGVARREGARPYHAVIIVNLSTGQRTIHYSASGVSYLAPEEVPEALVAASRVLLVDHYAGASALRAAEIAQAHRIPVVADVEGVPDGVAAGLLACASHLIVGVEMGRLLTGEGDPAAAAAALARADAGRPGGARACCAVTAGASGCFYSERGGGVQHFPAFQVDVVDTTGCGDVFHGAYAATIARGESVMRAIQVATAAAGIKATRPGGRAGIPDREALEAFLQSQRVRPGTNVW